MILLNYGTDVLQYIFNFVIMILEGMDAIWLWFNEPIKIGFEVFGVYIGLDPFTPLGLLGTALGTLIIWWLIKSLVPLL